MVDDPTPSELPQSDFAPNPKIEQQLIDQTMRRPPFDPDGKLVARAELRFGDVTYFPTAPLPPLAELAAFGVDERLLLVLWRNGKIDTFPSEESAAPVLHQYGATEPRDPEQPLPGTTLEAANPKPKKRSR